MYNIPHVLYKLFSLCLELQGPYSANYKLLDKKGINFLR